MRFLVLECAPDGTPPLSPTPIPPLFKNVSEALRGSKMAALSGKLWTDGRFWSLKFPSGLEIWDLWRGGGGGGVCEGMQPVPLNALIFFFPPLHFGHVQQGSKVM